MDGRNNVLCEGQRRGVKFENIYLNQYDKGRELQTGLNAYFDFDNHEIPHQSLNYRTPAEEHLVLWSEPAATVWMHLFFPFRGQNIGTHHIVCHNLSPECLLIMALLYIIPFDFFVRWRVRSGLVNGRGQWLVIANSWFLVEFPGLAQESSRRRYG